MENNMEKMNLADKCGYYDIARNHKEINLARSLGEKGIESYIKMGCYECSGTDTDCPMYFSPLKEYQKRMKK